MADLLFITHPEVVVDPDVPIEQWGLNETGQRRAARFAQSAEFAGVTRIWSSSERKAQDTSAILAASRGLPVETDPRLGENDRSATGFLPPNEFERAADTFFANPDQSFRGWETAADAQRRIHAVVCDLVRKHTQGDLAIVSHGAVGTLLWCALTERPIDRRYDQPSQGHFWRAGLGTLVPESGWLTLG